MIKRLVQALVYEAVRKLAGGARSKSENMTKTKNKYASVLPGLSPLPPEDESFQQRIDALKAELISMTPLGLVEHYIEVRRNLAAIALVEKNMNLRLEALTQMLVFSQDAGDEMWGQYGVGDNAVRLSSGDTVRVKAEPYSHVVDKDAFRLWCIDNGYGRQLQLHSSTTNAITKERLVAGQNPPEGVKAFRKDTLVYVKAGVKEQLGETSAP